MLYVIIASNQPVSQQDKMPELPIESVYIAHTIAGLGTHSIVSRDRGAAEVKSQLLYERRLERESKAAKIRLKKEGYRIITTPSHGITVLPNYKHRFDEKYRVSYIAFEIR